MDFSKMKMDTTQIIEDLGKTRWKKGQCSWESFMRKYNCDIICEIGVRVGSNFQEMIKHNPSVAVAIDSWVDDGIVWTNDCGFSQKVLDQQYQDFSKSVADKPFVKLYREYSFEAVKHFEDNYFDLVYIDADHSYQGCLGDINDWYPKVKKGGFLLGDDYRDYENKVPLRKYITIRYGVIEAVNEFAKENNVEFFKLPYYGWGMIKI